MLLLLIVGGCNIEMAFRRIWVQPKSHLVGSDRFIVQSHHVVGISQVVERGSVVGVQLNCLLVVFYSLFKLLLDTVGIAEIVKAFTLVGIQLDGLFVVGDSFVGLSK